MRKQFYSIIKNQATPNEADIMLYGIIGADMWGEGVQAKRFVSDFRSLEANYPRINIRVNGPGGSVWDGLPIFNVISNSKADTHSYNDGIAFSMSAVLLLAAKTVHVAKGSMTMLHNVSGAIGGNANDMREAADMLDKHDDLLSQMIADKTGKTVDEVKELYMNYKDNFLTGQEMMDSGLADVMDEYDLKDMPVDPNNMSLDAIAAFYNERTEEPSQSFLDKVTDSMKKLFPNALKNNTEMKFPKIFALKGITKPTAEQLTDAKSELVTEGLTGYGIYPEEEITNAATLTTENARLTGELTAANTAKITAESALVAAKASLDTTKASLDAANATILANATKITGLEAKVEAFGKAPGANHKNPEGAKDENPDAPADLATILNGLAHNKTADDLLG